jgi:hypothetical protein
MKMLVLCVMLALAGCGQRGASTPANNSPTGTAPAAVDKESEAAAIKLIAAKAEHLHQNDQAVRLLKLPFARKSYWYEKLILGDWTNIDICKGPIRTAAVDFVRWNSDTGKDMPGSVRNERLEEFAGAACIKIEAAIYAKEGVK